MNNTAAATLYDADTNEDLGPATEAQVAASDAANETGTILIDTDGDPVAAGAFGSAGARRVFTL